MTLMFWLLMVTLAVPTAMLASSVDFTNEGGKLSGSTAGLSLSGSTLIEVNGLNGMGLVTGNLGTVTFSTGALTSGSVKMGGTFEMCSGICQTTPKRTLRPRASLGRCHELSNFWTAEIRTGKPSIGKCPRGPKSSTPSPVRLRRSRGECLGALPNRMGNGY